MMGDADCSRRLTATVIRPSDEPGKHILGPLQPLEADDRGGAGFRTTIIDSHLGERIDPIARCRGLHCLGTSVLRHPTPRVRNIPVKDVRIESAHDRPGARAQTDNLSP